MKILPTLTVLLLSCFAGLSMASTIEAGAPLPQLAISDRGEVILRDDDKFSFSPWHSQQGVGKVHVLQYMAGTLSAKGINKPFTDRLEQEIDYSHYHVTTIINLDDAMWGTGRFVVSEVQKSKRKYPLSTMVLDEDGMGLKQWQLGAKSSAIIITDGLGKVLYLKEGAMSEMEISAALLLVQQHIGAVSDN